MGGTSLLVKRLRLQAASAGSAGSISAQGTNILYAVRYSQKEKTRKTAVKEFIPIGLCVKEPYELRFPYHFM